MLTQYDCSDHQYLQGTWNVLSKYYQRMSSPENRYILYLFSWMKYLAVYVVLSIFKEIANVQNKSQLKEVKSLDKGKLIIVAFYLQLLQS